MPFVSRRFAILSLLLILSLGVIGFRCWTVDRHAFLGDNYYHFRDLVEIKKSGEVPALGPYLTAPPARLPGGMYYLLLLIPHSLSPSIPALKTFAGMLGLLFAFLFVAYIYRRRSAKTALFLAALLFFNPYFTIFGSDYWNANFIFLPLLLFLTLLFELAEDRLPDAGAVLIFPLLAAIIQIHFSNVFVLPIPAVLFLWLHRRRLGPRKVLWLAVGMFFSIALYLPYLLSELPRHFHNTHLMLAMSRGAHSWIGPKLYAWFLFPTNEFSNYLGTGWPIIRDFYFHNPFLGRWGVLVFGFGVLSLVLVLGAFISFLFLLSPLRHRFEFSKDFEIPVLYRNAMSLAALMAASTLLFFLGLNIPGGGFHYFFAFFPLSFVPLLAVFDFLNERRPKWALSLLIFFLVNVLIQITVMTAFYRLYYEPLSYRHQVELVKKIAAYAGNRPFRILTRYEDDTRTGIYQQVGVPLFYEGIAREILHLEWRESPKAEMIFVLDAYDPAYNLAPIRFWETNRGREIWKSGNLKLSELIR